MRRLNQAEFGLYKQVLLVVGTAVVVLPLGFGTASAFYAAAIAALGVLTRGERAIIARPLATLQRRATTDRAA